jgi:hypothetical protein
MIVVHITTDEPLSILFRLNKIDLLSEGYLNYRPAKMPIQVTREETQIVLTGKTFDVKEKIKSLGGKWNPERRVWTLPLAMDSDELRTQLGALTQASVIEIAEAERRTASGGQARLKHSKAAAKNRELVEWCLADTSGKYSWVCCHQCEIVDLKKGHSSCRAHAHWDGQSWCSFRVFGSLYTGT